MILQVVMSNPTCIREIAEVLLIVVKSLYMTHVISHGFHLGKPCDFFLAVWGGSEFRDQWRGHQEELDIGRIHQATQT